MFTLWSYHFITSNIFSSTFYPMLCLPHSIGHGLAQCICGYPIDLIEIHLLQYSHRGKHNTTHETKTFCFMGNIVLSHGNMKYNILVMELFTKNLGFHVSHEQTHVHMLLSLHVSCQQVDIMFIPNGVCNLINVTNIDLNWIGLVSQVAMFRTMVTTMAT
jgi:hypothetical protein